MQFREAYRGLAMFRKEQRKMGVCAELINHFRDIRHASNNLLT